MFAVGIRQSAETESQGRVGIHFQGAVQYLNGAFIITSNVAVDERSDAEGERIARAEADCIVSVLQGSGAVLLIKATPKISLLVAPCGVSMGGRVVLIKFQGRG